MKRPFVVSPKCITPDLQNVMLFVTYSCFISLFTPSAPVVFTFKTRMNHIKGRNFGTPYLARQLR